jgi:hypothetical protein
MLPARCGHGRDSLAAFCRRDRHGPLSFRSAARQCQETGEEQTNQEKSFHRIGLHQGRVACGHYRRSRGFSTTKKRGQEMPRITHHTFGSSFSWQIGLLSHPALRFVKISTMNIVLFIPAVLLAAEPLAPGNHIRTLQVDGRNRSYLVHVPQKCKPPTPVQWAFFKKHPME